MSRSSLMGAVVMAGMALSGGQPLAQVSCGSTINQNTTLTADLNNCPGNGVVIGASGITLDLGGHTIDGDGDDVGNGVDNTQGHDQVTIENGRIREFGTGVRLANADRNRLRELVASYNSEGIFLSDSDNNRIEGNTTSDNDNTGITLTGAGDGSDDNRVDENSSSDNENFGIAVENSSDSNRIRRNEANNNGLLDGNSGLLIDGTSTGTRVEDNVTNRNKADGISVGNVMTTTVMDNRANNNGQWGINVVASGTDRGGNRARGNGNAAQCMNVDC